MAHVQGMHIEAEQFQVLEPNEFTKILSILDERKDENAIDTLSLDTFESQVPGSIGTVWKILSHPHSKIAAIHVAVRGIDPIVQSRIMKTIKDWCTTVPARSPRSIRIEFRGHVTERSRECLVGLREALTAPGNRVQELHLEGLTANLGTGDLLLRPVLEDPNNELQKMYTGDFSRFADDDFVALALAFESEHCKLREFQMDFDGIRLTGAVCIIDGLRSVSSLHRLVLGDRDILPTEEAELHRKLFTYRMGRWLEQPGNQLRSLRWLTSTFNETDGEVLAKAIMSEHCHLEDFDFEYTEQPEDATVPLFRALRHPNCKLKRLTGIFVGNDAGVALAESLQDPNCKLETLILGEDSEDLTDPLAAIAIAAALKSASFSQLRTLSLRTDSADVLPAFTDSLLSPGNKLKNLSLRISERADETDRKEFRRALRRSNVHRLEDSESADFRETFNSPSLQVLYTLLSIKHLPRLGLSAPIRSLPVHDFISKIGQTLGWDLLEYLRT